MKSIFDASFKYKPSFDTDLRETFLRVRRDQQAHLLGEQHAEVRRDQQASEDFQRSHILREAAGCGAS